MGWDSPPPRHFELKGVNGNGLAISVDCQNGCDTLGLDPRYVASGQRLNQRPVVLGLMDHY